MLRTQWVVPPRLPAIAGFPKTSRSVKRMIRRLTVASLLAASLVLAGASIAFAQETKYPDILDAKPMFKAGPNHMELAPRAPAANLAQWNGGFTDLTNKKITYTMVGTDPSK